MTILSPSKLVPNRRQLLWNIASELGKAGQWVDGVEKAEYLRGNSAGVGGVWRVHLRRNSHADVIEFEITEWLKGHRFGLRPVRPGSVYGDIQLFELVLDFKEVSENETRIEIHCEYEPLSKLGRVKNLAFLRRQYLDLIDHALDKLSAVAAVQEQACA